MGTSKLNLGTRKDISKNKDGSYSIIDKFDGISYRYKNLKYLNEMLLKAVELRMMKLYIRHILSVFQEIRMLIGIQPMELSN